MPEESFGPISSHEAKLLDEIRRLKLERDALRDAATNAESQIRKGWSQINRSISPNYNVALLDICNGLEKLAALNKTGGE